MSDESILHGLLDDTGLTRRAFGTAAAATAVIAAAPADAEAQVTERDVE